VFPLRLAATLNTPIFIRQHNDGCSQRLVQVFGGMSELAAATAVVAMSIDDKAEKDSELGSTCTVAESMQCESHLRRTRAWTSIITMFFQKIVKPGQRFER